MQDVFWGLSDPRSLGRSPMVDRRNAGPNVHFARDRHGLALDFLASGPGKLCHFLLVVVTIVIPPVYDRPGRPQPVFFFRSIYVVPAMFLPLRITSIFARDS